MEILDLLVAVLPPWIEKQMNRRKDADAAVSAVLEASTATTAYAADTQNAPRQRDRELELTKLWTAASVAIRRIDPEFAQLLHMKAEYWCDPTRWSDEDVRRAGISLKDVKARARSFLGGAL
jgi:hypothetical protein